MTDKQSPLNGAPKRPDNIPPMGIQLTAFHCLKCKHEWIGEIVVNAPLSVAMASIKALQCPMCGANSKNVAFGRGNVPEPAPCKYQDMTDYHRRNEWLKLHDNGLSSECIADVMCGIVPRGHYPSDGDDFGRCERLLTLYPRWRERLGEMTAVNKQWAALVPRWPEIAEAYRADRAAFIQSHKPKGQKPTYRCYALIRSILDSVESGDGVVA